VTSPGNAPPLRSAKDDLDTPALCPIVYRDGRLTEILPIADGDASR
jgi:hypothetical protein